MVAGEEAGISSYSPDCPSDCPAVKPTRPGPLLICPGNLMGYGNIRELALPPNALDPSTKFNDLYRKLAPLKCSGIVLNDMLPGSEPDWKDWNLSEDGYWRPLFGMWTSERAFDRQRMRQLSQAMDRFLSHDGVKLPVNVGPSLPTKAAHGHGHDELITRVCVERALSDTFSWVRRFDPMASWRMFMRHRMYHAPTTFFRPNACTTSIHISTGSTDWGRHKDHLSQDYTMTFCINRSYRFHYRLFDDSEYCILLRPGTVIGFLGGVFEHRLELVPVSESGEPFDDDEAFVFTCYTSRKLFGEGGTHPTPHAEMHIHPLKQHRNNASDRRRSDVTSSPVDKGWPKHSHDPRRESLESAALPFAGETDSPRSPKRLKTTHEPVENEEYPVSPLIEVLRRKLEEEGQLKASPKARNLSWRTENYIDPHGKMYLRETVNIYHLDTDEGDWLLDPKTAIRRSVWELDPLSWPKYSVFQFRTAFGRKSAPPLVSALSRFASLLGDETGPVYCYANEGRLADVSPGQQSVMDWAAMREFRKLINALMKHTSFTIHQKDPRTAIRMRLRHAFYCENAEGCICTEDTVRGDKAEGAHDGIVTSFSVTRCRKSMPWTRGSDHSSQDYTLVFCPNRDFRIHLRTPLHVDPRGDTDVFEVPCGDCFAFLAELYEYRVELEGPEDYHSFFVTCFTSKSVSAAEEAKGRSLPCQGVGELGKVLRKAIPDLWSSRTLQDWWR